MFASVGSPLVISPKVPPSFVLCLERLLVHLVRFYSKFHRAQRFGAAKAMARMYRALYAKGTLLQRVMGHTFYQGLLTVCTLTDDDDGERRNASSVGLVARDEKQDALDIDALPIRINDLIELFTHILGDMYLRDLPIAVLPPDQRKAMWVLGLGWG